MTYRKPACFEFPIFVLDGVEVPEGTLFALPSIKTATWARIVEFKEQIVGKATVKWQWEDDAGNVIDAGRWLTTMIPDSLIGSYRNVLTGTATVKATEYFESLILNSPEGNAEIASP